MSRVHLTFRPNSNVLSLARQCSVFILSSLLLSLVSSPVLALDILNFELASASRPTAQAPIKTAAATISLASNNAQPISFNTAINSQPSPGQSSPLSPQPSDSLTAMRTAHGQSQREQLLFDGGANSLVAVAVGNAEGTRTARGDRTPAYAGHRDPGNGAWNQGSFSYQHRASSPEDADQKQLARLSTQAADLRQQAQTKGIDLTLAEELSGIDLANQAPLAALDQGGYIDWLQEAKQRQFAANEAIIWARTWSYWDPQLDNWNAPGLGNSWDSIYADQERRHWAVVQATEYFRL